MKKLDSKELANLELEVNITIANLKFLEEALSYEFGETIDTLASLLQIAKKDAARAIVGLPNDKPWSDEEADRADELWAIRGLYE